LLLEFAGGSERAFLPDGAKSLILAGEFHNQLPRVDLDFALFVDAIFEMGADFLFLGLAAVAYGVERVADMVPIGADRLGND